MLRTTFQMLVTILTFIHFSRWFFAILQLHVQILYIVYCMLCVWIQRRHLTACCLTRARKISKRTGAYIYVLARATAASWLLQLFAIVHTSFLASLFSACFKGRIWHMTSKSTLIGKKKPVGSWFFLGAKWGKGKRHKNNSNMCAA